MEQSETLDLGAAVEHLELENLFLAHLLQRVSSGSGATNAAADDAAAATEIGREPLLLAERQELCAEEVEVARRDIKALMVAGQLECACAVAAAADCHTHQAAEVGRAVAALLGLLGFSQPDTATAAAMAAASAAAAPTAATEQPGAIPQADERLANSSCARSPPGSPAEACLPTAKRLARVQLDGRQTGQFLEELLKRQDVTAERLHTRAAMLQAQLVRTEAQLAQRTEQGATLSRVDFEQLRIEHAQAEAAMAEATAEAVSLKAAAAAAQQHLADQRAALSSAATATAALKKEAGGREGQLEVLRGEVGKAERECSLLERECARLRQQHGRGDSRDHKLIGGEAAQGKAGHDANSGSASVGGQTIMDYIRLKQAVGEAQKAVADWKRKLEVAAGAVAGRC